MERQGQTTSRVLPYLVRLVIGMARARWGVRAWLGVRCVRRVGLCWQRMLRKRVKWLLFKGVSECLKWSHQRIVCRELGCEARGGGGRARDCAVRTAGGARPRRRVGGGLCAVGELDSQPIAYSQVERAPQTLV